MWVHAAFWAALNTYGAFGGESFVKMITLNIFFLIVYLTSVVELMDNYVVRGKIGGGAQGSVFEVTRRSDGSVYALKVICCTDQQQVNTAIKEVKFLVALRHPHIVSYEDFFLQLHIKNLHKELCIPDAADVKASLFDSLYMGKNAIKKRHSASSTQAAVDEGDVGVCLIMELCSNGDLQSVIASIKDTIIEIGHHPTDEQTIVCWMRQCAEALEYIHANGFIHRDLKPMNVFFDSHGDIKLGDFGVASIGTGGCYSAVGTPDYLAPEQMLQEVYDEKIDIWGLGMVFLETITLRNHPINSRVLQNPDSVGMVVDLVTKMGFSRQLGELIKSMLQRQPSNRPSASRILSTLADAYPLVIQGPILRRRSVLSFRSSPVCAVCEVERCTISCEECQETYCRVCDSVRHKHPSRSSHHRFKLYSTPQFSGITVDSSKLSTPSATLRVPQDCSLTQAVCMAMNSPVERICVSSGYVSEEPLVLKELYSPSLTIIGDSPPPTIDVKSELISVHLSSGGGVLENLIIRHSGRRSCLASKDGKQPRPTAVRISGGNWKVKQCIISCKEGSGLILSKSQTVSSCTFTDIKTAAVVFTDESSGTVENSSFARCGYAAIVLKAKSNPRVIQNKIQDCVEMGVICEDSMGVLEDNCIRSVRGPGVVLKGRHAAPLLSKNTITCNQAGIMCTDFSEPYVVDNEISANQKAGILVKGKSSPVVKRNIICDGAEAGMYIFEEGSGIFVQNRICNNKNAGILVTTMGCPEVSHNTINSNSEGVWVCNGGGGNFIHNNLRSNINGPKDIDHKCSVQWEDNIE